MIKHILAPLTGAAESAHVPMCALQLARQLTAHVTAGFAEPPNLLFTPPAGPGVTPGMYEEYFSTLKHFRDDRRHGARAAYDAAVLATKLPIVTKPLCAQASTEWLDGTEGDGDPIPALGPLADLVVLNFPGNSRKYEDWHLLEQVLFSVKRPVLLVPPKHGQVRFDRPMIAWNGSLEAANAARAGMDLFEAGAKVTILQVGKLRPGAIPAERLADDLGWHCFETKVHQVEDLPNQTAGIILGEAATCRASVVVMGAYTHSRTRELILGGVTDFMLRHGTRPLLLAH